MREPVNRTILLFDIERFGHRDDVEQAFLRRKLHDIAEDTLLAAGVEATQQYREDRGDGLVVLISADVSKVALLRALLTAAPDQLHTYNRFAAESTQLRLRMVLAAGEVAFDPLDGTLGGVVGHDLNQACRLLDASVLREELRQRTDTHSVLCISESIYKGVIQHGHTGVRPEEFRPVNVRVKEGQLGAWVHDVRAPTPSGRVRTAEEATATERGDAGEAGEVPGHGGSAQGSAQDSAQGSAQGAASASGRTSSTAPEGGATFHFHGGPPVVGGSIVGGDQHGVSGGTVTGDVVLGGQDSDRKAQDGVGKRNDSA